MTSTQETYIAIIKRPLGFLGASLAIILISPIFIGTIIVLYFANKNGFKGIFFTQDRPGKNEKTFRVIKFKSMTDDRDADGYLLPDRERLTKAGKFIRGTSIDELPQLFNILKGDMAFIGPRPLLHRYLPYYTEREHHRHDVRPGMTGWSQIHGRNTLGWDDKFEMDVYYVEHISLAIDIKIFFLTVWKVLKREGDIPDKKENFFDIERQNKMNNKI